MRKDFLPFAKPSVSDDVLPEIAESIRQGWLAMGPKTIEFENVFKDYTDASYALSVNSATAGLHAAVASLGIGEGDEVITTPMTFAATVNAIIFTGAKPVLVDIDATTRNIIPENIEKAITPRTKAIIPVHFAGLPCQMDEIEDIAKRHNLAIIEDAAHALGAVYKGRKIGANRGARHLTVFSFHPTKNITTGEGGMICTEDEECAENILMFRQNGMSKGAWNRYSAKGSAAYDILHPGLKYTTTDLSSAIGISQMRQLEAFNNRRRELVAFYMKELASVSSLILPPVVPSDLVHSWHIFTPLVDIDKASITRDEFMARLKERNIGTGYHYQALHLFSCYGELTGLGKGSLPNAEYVSERIVSLPLFPAMTDEDANDVVQAIKEVLN